MRHRFTLALALFALSMGLLSACAVTALDGAETSLVYVGMDGYHVHALRFDGNTGHLTMLGPVAEVPKPRWALAHPRLPILYVAADGHAQDGSAIAFAVDHETGALTRINEVAAGGSGTTFTGGSRIDRIAERTGMNKRLIYYFGNKDDLFLAVLERV